MNMQRAMKLIGIWILLIIIILPNIVCAENLKKQVWETSIEVKAILNSLLGEIEPTLPAAKLKEEPYFTWGLDNTIYWNSASVRSQLLDLGMVLAFFEIQARYDETILWGFVDQYTDSATFVNLPEKKAIEYYLRYFAQDASGTFYMSYWSDPEISVQDISPPVIWSVQVLDLQESQHVKWVIGPTISIHVVASDHNGQVMELGIREQNTAGDHYLYHAFEPPSDSINVSIPYTMRSNAKELSTLTIWVIDVAEQLSETFSITLFWWPGDDEEDIICFPNPFNPDRNETSIIRVNAANEEITEARIFDPFGNLVQVLTKGSSQEFFEWDGRNQYGDMVSNGGYICLVNGQSRFYCKIAVLR